MINELVSRRSYKIDEWNSTINDEDEEESTLQIVL